MTSILNALFESVIFPNKLKPTPESTRANEELANLIEAWNKSHSEEDWEKFDDIQSAYNNVSHHLQQIAFTYGFQLAILIMIEVFFGKSEFTRNHNKN